VAVDGYGDRPRVPSSAPARTVLPHVLRAHLRGLLCAGDGDRARGFVVGDGLNARGVGDAIRAVHGAARYRHHQGANRPLPPSLKYLAVVPREFDIPTRQVQEGIPLLQEESVCSGVLWKRRQQTINLCILPCLDGVTIHLQV
jgi:hypothetical protein